MIWSWRNKNVYSIEVIEVLFRYTCLLGITPAVNFQDFSISRKPLHVVVASLWTTILCYFYVYFVYGYINYVAPYLHFTVLIVDMLLYSGLTFYIVLLFLMASTKNMSLWGEIIYALYFQGSTHKQKNYFLLKYSIVLELIFLNLVVLGSMLYERIINYIAFADFDTPKYYYYISVEEYIIFQSVLLKCQLALCINYRVKLMNNKLLGIKKSFALYINSFSLSKILNNYEDIRFGFDLYNKLFGWNIFVLFGIIVLKLLESVNFVRFLEVSMENSEWNLKVHTTVSAFFKTVLVLVSYLITASFLVNIKQILTTK